jgi:hypothetical protein
MRNKALVEQAFSLFMHRQDACTTVPQQGVESPSG